MKSYNVGLDDQLLSTIKLVPSLSVAAVAVVTNISVRWITLQFTDQWIILLVNCS